MYSASFKAFLATYVTLPILFSMNFLVLLPTQKMFLKLISSLVKEFKIASTPF